ncbi:Bug family tripartite tricarboxylate transporter substrate binding protein [Alicycliphilus denitrificans]|uniref:Bug family tripartite tricarboxylate transporter substrate binding protein n=1 Tax=Alicycliphilus denitrificans TaxID=179636 RepID=UPI003A813D50
MRFQKIRRTLLVLAAIHAANSAMATDYPTQPITLVVPFAAGGMTDILARQFAKIVQTRTGQATVVENKPGAGGIIGATRVARAKPDGYTLLVTTTAHVVNPSITKNLPYNTEKDFAPIAMLARTPNVLLVNPSLPVKTIPELLDYARKNNGVSYGSSGPGGTTHLSGELLASKTGAPLIHVAYKGTALAVNDLLGGQIQASFVDGLSALRYIKAGSLRAIGVSTKERNPMLPEVPTIAEQGVPGYETEIWIGLYAPAGTPTAILDKLNTLALESMNEAAFKKTLDEQATTPGSMDAVQTRSYVSREIKKWGDIVKKAGIEPQ